MSVTTRVLATARGRPARVREGHGRSRKQTRRRQADEYAVDDRATVEPILSGHGKSAKPKPGPSHNIGLNEVNKQGNFRAARVSFRGLRNSTNGSGSRVARVLLVEVLVEVNFDERAVRQPRRRLVARSARQLAQRRENPGKHLRAFARVCDRPSVGRQIAGR
jgi:hypothetical protein